MTRPPRGITVFIPAYNEQDLVVPNVRRVLAFLEDRAAGMPHEVVVGSNGSTDDTVELLAGLAGDDPRVTWFHLPEKGVGAAFREGVRRARYDRIVTVDMDLSIDLGFVPRAAALLDTCDVVVGSKITGDQQRPWLRKSVSNLFISLARVLLSIHYSDYSIAAKGYRTSLARQHLHRVDDKTFYVVRVVYHARQDRRRIVEIPVDCHDMRGSRFNLLHEGVYKFGNLFLLWARRVLRGERR
ncbi:MAG: glycosyltransferase family 2 protein [Desulfatibacillaceae bacterium]